jgi:predicted phosphate transport protein (TIGR00153 family)
LVFFGGKQTDFFKLLFDQAAKTVEGVEALSRFVDSLDPVHGQKVKAIESQADEIRRVLIEEINQTFVTPVDREDLFALSRAIDDVLDYANTTVYEFEVYKLERADEHVKHLVRILYGQAQELHQAIKTLDTYPRLANEHAIKAKKAENLMERAYREALGELFQGTDTVYMLKMREIYRHLSNAADRGDEAANTIHSIVVKRGGS